MKSVSVIEKKILAIANTIDDCFGLLSLTWKVKFVEPHYFAFSFEMHVINVDINNS